MNIVTLSVEDREELLRSRVAAGIALLNERQWSKPWYQVIDLDQLDIHSSTNCVLGQLFGSYADAMNNELGLAIGTLHGFSGYFENKLTEIWTEEILKLRENHVQ